MKELSVILKKNKWDSSPVSQSLSFSTKLSFGTAMAMLLSSISPVAASNLAITAAKNLSQNSPDVNYPKGSHGSIVFSGDDDYCGADNVIGRGGTTVRTATAITVEEEYRRFLEYRIMNGFSPYSQSSEKQKWTGDGKTTGNIGYMGKDSTGGDKDIMPEAYGIYSFATGCGSSATGNYSVAFGANATARTGGSQAFGVAALASGKVTVAIGVGSEASGDAGVALGGLATASGERSIAIGTRSSAQGEESIAIGSGTKGEKQNNSALAMGIQAIAIGSHAVGSQDYSVVVGASAVASVSKGIALGYGSVADVGDGILGYNPMEDAPSKDKSATWKSSVGALSIGNPKENITRQITGVASGSEDTDAVNVAQLKALRAMITEQGSWDLVVTGAENIVIGSGEKLELKTGSNNFKITSDSRDKKVTFDLAKNITLESVKTGENTLDKTGLIIKDGPQITTTGVNAGNKKITGVKKGTDETDAVNFAQLKELKDSISTSTSKDGLSEWNKDKVRIGVPGNKAERKGAVAIGRTLESHETSVLADYGIAIGSGARVKENAKDAISFGRNSEVLAEDGVALGAFSIADRAKYVRGYDPRTGKTSVRDPKNPFDGVWENTYGAVSVGASKISTRQIMHVAAGSEDDDAVNVGQLKALRSMITEQGSWNLSVGDKKTVVDPGNTLTLAAENSNLIITSDDKEKKVTFDLAHDITLESVKAGENTLDKTGLIIANGPKVMTVGIDAGNKKITGVAEGANDTDAVNFAQLKQIEKDVKEQVASSSFVKQNADTQHITIGKDTDGDKIDIANNKNEQRTLTGIKEAALSAESNEAVTGSQLFETNNDVTTLKNNFSKIQISVAGVQTNLSTIANNTSQYLGGDANVLNGKAPTYTFEDKSYHDVASAFSGVSSSFTEVKQQITNVNNSITNVENQIKNVVSESLVQQEKGTQHITIGKDIGGDKVDIANKNGDKRTLTGIKEAALLEDSNEAVTGSQLFETNNKVATYLGGGASYKDGKWSDPTFKVQTFDDQGNKKDEAYTDVAAAFVGVSTSIMNVQNKVTNDIKNKFSELNQNITNITQQVTGDALLWNDEAQAFAALHKKKVEEQEKTTGAQENSKITFLLDGAVSKDSTDAITGKQLYSTSNMLATYLDKGAGYDAEGNWKAPNFKVKTVNGEGKEEDKTYPDVAEAFEGVGTSLTNVQNNVTEQINHVINKVKSKNLVQQEKETNNITIGAKKEGTIINIANKSGEDRMLSGVKAATKDNEAVNKGQLDTSIKNANNEITNKFNAFTKNITNITQQVKGDALLWDKDEKAFIADHGEGSTKTKSKITHLLDGAISSGSTDAITGSQLYSMGSAVSASLGGGASYEGGSWATPTFTVNKFDIKGNVTQEDYKTVADALSGLSTSLTNLHNEMNNEIAHVKDESLVKQDNKTKLITVGREKDGTVINIANKDKEDRTLSGIKAATQDNEAINKAQLDKLDKKIETTNSFAVFYDKQSDDTVNYKSITLGGTNKEPVSLHNVSDGELTQESHDAINGGQITKIFQQVVKYFGGNAVFKGGIFTGPIYKLLSISESGVVEQKEHDNIVSAFDGLNTNIKNVNERIKEVSQGISDDSLLWDKNKEAFVALHGEGETRTNSKITYLKDGDITANSSDAVNGSQLYSLNEQLATYFGGGAEYKEGKWIAPNFKIKQFSEEGSSEEKSYSNIADALRGVGNSFTNIQHKITHEINKIASENLVKQDEKTKRITIGGEKDGSEINIVNSVNGVRSLSGVKAGFLAAESTEAINGSQLYSVINVLSRYFSRDAEYKDGKWFAPGFKVTQFTADGVVSKRENYTNVASAFEGVNESMIKINNRIHDVEQSIFSSGLNWSETEKAFDARHKGQDSKIKHVADGEISEGSKEVVNGNQLWQTNKKVEAVKSHVNKLDKQVKDIAGVADIAVKYDKGNDGKKKNKVTLIGMSESDPVLIDNVADGRIESGSKEAVTGGQLYDYTDQQMNLVLSDAQRYTDERFNDIVNNTVNNVFNETKSYTDIKFEALRYEIKEIRKESKQAAAVGLAVSNLSYEDTPGSLSLSIGTGVWRNQYAFAIGAGYMSENGKIRSNISATSSGGHWGIGAGLRVKLN